MTRQQAKGLLWLALTVLVAWAVAYGLPRLARSTPWPVERLAGRVLDRGRTACGAGRPASQAALDKLVARLYPLDAEDRTFPLSVQVVASTEVNAFAFLGGRVYVNDALLREAESPEEVAGVLAHEIEHVRRRHIIEGFMSRLLTFGALSHALGGAGGLARTLLDLSFSRDQERQADEGGLARLRRARVSPDGFARFFERLAAKGSGVPALLSDHPASDDRAELVKRFSGGPSEPVLTPAEWDSLKAICR